MKKQLTIFIIAVALVTACKKDKATEKIEDLSGCKPDSSVAVSYCRDVSPIIKNNCALSGCHSSSSQAAGIMLSDYTTISDETKNGKLVCTIQHTSGCNPMPIGASKLSDADIAKVVAWKNGGALNN